MKLFAITLMLLAVACSPMTARAQRSHKDLAALWRTATADELAEVLPARAPVLQERIETEATANSGITDTHGRVIAVTVLITAGYAAHGKYSQYLVAGAPVEFGASVALKPGAYLLGWTRDEAGLHVSFYEAANGNLIGSVEALPSNPPLRVVPVRLWPPVQRSILQIGRFVIPYELR
ncbi:hypothetical protein SAMN05421819_2733 [Bryocella elongata]|uniref:Uncharacterized protein n=1 Tax=Bryocella elongata TaxID=863522 RepID=A0A1H5ZN65_9BACT|nr:hypothetical protein [Bryocella elongata]SEG37107.1 hypothetical protein SAMN05421819_2733 [Bryocella elongata]